VLLLILVVEQEFLLGFDVADSVNSDPTFAEDIDHFCMAVHSTLVARVVRISIGRGRRVRLEIQKFSDSLDYVAEACGVDVVLVREIEQVAVVPCVVDRSSTFGFGFGDDFTAVLL
jgi:hypothetical protein